MPKAGNITATQAAFRSNDFHQASDIRLDDNLVSVELPNLVGGLMGRRQVISLHVGAPGVLPGRSLSRLKARYWPITNRSHAMMAADAASGDA